MDEFGCHPACLQRSYWRRLLLDVEAEIRGLGAGELVDLVLDADEKAERARSGTASGEAVEVVLARCPPGRDPGLSRAINRTIQRRFAQGWSYRQIADHCGIPETRVKSRIQYLRRKGRMRQPARGNPRGVARRAAE